METLFVAGFRALRSIFVPGMFGVFLWSIFITLLALIGFVVLISTFSGLIAAGVEDPSWAAAIPFMGTVGAALLAWILFPGIMPIIVNFFDARISRLIEAYDYPATVASNPTPFWPEFWPEFWHDARFSMLAIFLNILILPLYLLMPGLHLIPFYLLNGYLLGREFFVMAARRHIPIEQAIALRKKNGRIVLAAGVSLAFLATMPLINLVAPFWGIAIMVHLYHHLAGTPRSKLIINQTINQ
jgi:CysZ protein